MKPLPRSSGGNRLRKTHPDAHEPPEITLTRDGGLADQSMAQDGKPPEFLFDPCLSTAIAANGKQRSVVPVRAGPLAPDLLDKMNRYRRAAASSLIRRQGSVGRAKRLDPAFQ